MTDKDLPDWAKEADAQDLPDWAKAADAASPGQIPGQERVPPPVPQAEDSGFNTLIRGPAEVATALAVAPVGAVASPIAGAAKSIWDRINGRPDGGEKAAQAVQQALAWQPRTQAGKRQLQGLLDAIPPDVARTLQALPMFGGEMAALGKGVAAAAPAVKAGATAAAAAVSKLAGVAKDAAIQGGKGAAQLIPEAPTLRKASIVGKLQEKYGHEPNRMRAQAEGVARAATSEAEEGAATGHSTARADAEGADALARRYRGSEAQVKLRAQQRAQESLATNLAPVVSDDVAGAALKQSFERARTSAYEARSRAADYDGAKAAAVTREAAGNSFASSSPGQAVIAEMNAMKRPVNGLSRLTERQVSDINDLIETIRGRSASTRQTPFGPAEVSPIQPGQFAKLQGAVRELRKVNEKPGNETTGFAALGAERARELSRILVGSDENGHAVPGKGLYAWNPEYAQADAAYQAHSDAIARRFGVEKAASAGRGEGFDFKAMAASPGEFPRTFFKDAQSVQQLLAATQDPAAVTAAAKQWAAKQMRGMDGAASKQWATDNASWIQEAGITREVATHAADMARQDITSAANLAQVKARAAYLGDESRRAISRADKAIADLQAARGDIDKTMAARKKIAQHLENVFTYAEPGNLKKYFDTSLRSDLESTGMFSPQALDEMARDLAMADKQGNRTKWFRKAASTAAYGVGGVGAGHAVGLL